MLNTRQGDIFFVDFGNPIGSEPGYLRPCVIIQNDVFNQSRINTVVLCLITSNLQRAKSPGNVLLNKGEGGLMKDSIVNISQIITIDRSHLLEKSGTLSKARMKEIIEGIKLLIEPRENI